MKKTRRKFSSAFKAKVAIEALKERQSLPDLALKYEIHPAQINKWKKDFIDNASAAFELSGKKEEDEHVDVDLLYSKIGRLEIERDFLKKSLKKTGLL
jgi:transposase-like protein